MSNKNLTIGLVVAIVIAIGGLFFPSQVQQTIQKGFGAVTGITNYDNLGILGLKLGTTCNDGNAYSGCNGTAFTRMNGGQCYFTPSSATIAASTTVNIDCQATAGIWSGAVSALTGVASGDNVVVTLGTTTASGSTGTAKLGMGLALGGCIASSTSGFITCQLDNLTGGTFTWPTGNQAASGTASYFVTK